MNTTLQSNVSSALCKIALSLYLTDSALGHKTEGEPKPQEPKVEVAKSNDSLYYGILAAVAGAGVIYQLYKNSGSTVI
jgi:hypothetical protein